MQRLIEALRPEDFLPPTVFYDNNSLPIAVKEESLVVNGDGTIVTLEGLCILDDFNPLTTYHFSHTLVKTIHNM